MFKHVCLVGSLLLLVIAVIPILAHKSGHIHSTGNRRSHEVFHLLKQTKERVKHGIRKFSCASTIFFLGTSRCLFRMCSTIEIFCWFLLYLHENVPGSILGRSLQQLPIASDEHRCESLCHWNHRGVRIHRTWSDRIEIRLGKCFGLHWIT